MCALATISRGLQVTYEFLANVLEHGSKDRCGLWGLCPGELCDEEFKDRDEILDAKQIRAGLVELGQKGALGASLG